MDSRHLLTSDLARAGYSPTELARLNRTGALVHLRRGAWLAEEPADEAVRHRLLVAATLDLTADAVVSHGSAAVLHGLPSFETLTRVHLTRSAGRGKRRGGTSTCTSPPSTPPSSWWSTASP